MSNCDPQQTIRETRRWIRLQVINRMAGPSDNSKTWLSDAVLAKTPNGFWIAWRQQDPSRIGLLPQGTPRTCGCLWLENHTYRSFEKWNEFITSGRYEQQVLREALHAQTRRSPKTLKPTEIEHRPSAEVDASHFVLRLSEAAVAAGISVSTLQLLVRLNEFPKPRQLSARRVGWLRREVEAWAESRPHSDLLPPPNTGALKPRRK